MRKICLLRLSALGDATHALAVVRAIQHAEPDAEITWIIGKLEHRLMQGLDNVRLVMFDKSAGRKSFGQLRRDLNGERFDVLLHQQVALRANLASMMVRAKLRIGFDRVRARDGHGLFVNRRIPAADGQHVLDGLLSFLPEAGLSVPQRPVWNLPLAAADLDFAQRHVAADRPVLTLCPVSSHPLRNWAPERYAEVADFAAEALDMQVVLAGSPAPFEQKFNRQIETRMRQPALNLTGKDTLKELAGLLQRSDLVLAPDTGPMHIANAVGTPVVGLHAASNPLRSGPYDSAQWCVDQYDAAARQFLGRPAAELRWGQKIEKPGVMDLISVDQVTDMLSRFAADKFGSGNAG